MSAFTLSDLTQLIGERATAVADRSYTRTLLDAGLPRIAKKFGEEAIEAIIAATQGDKGQLVAESADVLYHLMVMLHAAGLSMNDVIEELGRRTRQSGLDEKKSRPTAS